MPDILTREQVAECRERAERATDGPWEALGDEIVTYAVPRTASHPVQTVAMSGVCIEEAEAEFVAHARVDIPALCATVEALREENERLREALLQIVGLPDAHARSLEIAVDALAALEARDE